MCWKIIRDRLEKEKCNFYFEPGWSEKNWPVLIINSYHIAICIFFSSDLLVVIFFKLKVNIIIFIFKDKFKIYQMHNAILL